MRLIWKANFNLISKADLFKCFHILFQISFQKFCSKFYRTKNIAIILSVRSERLPSIVYRLKFSLTDSKMGTCICRFARPQTGLLFTDYKYFLFKCIALSILYHSHRDKPIGRWGKKIVPQENHLTHPQAELGLCHMLPVRVSNLHQPKRWGDRIIKSVEISDPTHSVPGAAITVG